jgi:hypothetical protein
MPPPGAQYNSAHRDQSMSLGALPPDQGHGSSREPVKCLFAQPDTWGTCKSQGEGHNVEPVWDSICERCMETKQGFLLWSTSRQDWALPAIRNSVRVEVEKRCDFQHVALEDMATPYTCLLLSGWRQPEQWWQELWTKRISLKADEECPRVRGAFQLCSECYDLLSEDGKRVFWDTDGEHNRKFPCIDTMPEYQQNRRSMWRRTEHMSEPYRNYPGCEKVTNAPHRFCTACKEHWIRPDNRYTWSAWFDEEGTVKENFRPVTTRNLPGWLPVSNPYLDLLAATNNQQTE